MVPGTAIYVIFHATVILKKSSGEVLFHLNQNYLLETAVILQNYILLDFFVVYPQMTLTCTLSIIINAQEL